MWLEPEDLDLKCLHLVLSVLKLSRKAEARDAVPFPALCCSEVFLVAFAERLLRDILCGCLFHASPCVLHDQVHYDIAVNA